MKYAILLNGELVHTADTLKALKENTANVIISESGGSAKAYICLLGTRNYFLKHTYKRPEWSDKEIKADALYNYYSKALRYFGMDLLQIIN